jgi:hypothetical protein
VADPKLFLSNLLGSSNPVQERGHLKDLILKIIGYLPRYLNEFGDLLVAPKRFLRVRNVKPQETLSDALVFLGVSLSVGVIMQLQLLPKGLDVWGSLAGVATSTLVGLALMASVLRLAWRFVGGKASTRSYFVTQAYVSGAAIIVIFVVVLIGVGVLKVFDPLLYAQVRAARPGLGQIPDLSGSIAPPVVLATIGCVILLSAVWGFATWGAYRELNHVGRLRSGVAFVLTGILGWLVAGVVFFLQHAMTPGAD